MKFKISFSFLSIVTVMLIFSDLAHAHYHPAIGRFVNRDPIEERDGVNVYAFVRNQPINHIDNLGLKYSETGDSTRNNKFSDFVYQRQPFLQDKLTLSKIKSVLKEIGELKDPNGNECFNATLHYDSVTAWELWAETWLPTLGGAKTWAFHIGHGIDYGIAPQNKPNSAKPQQYLIVKDGYLNTQFLQSSLNADTSLVISACYHAPERDKECTSIQAQNHLLSELIKIRNKFKKDYCKDCSSIYKHIVTVSTGGLSNTPRNGKTVFNDIDDLNYPK